MQKIIRFLLSRVFLVGTAIAVQVTILITVIHSFSNYFVLFYSVCTVLSLLVVLWIINGRRNPAYKIAWIVPIMIFPIFGGLFFLIFGGNKYGRKIKSRMKHFNVKMKAELPQQPEVLSQIEQLDLGAANITKYIAEYSYCPVYTGSATQYLTPGEKKFERLLEELKKAKRYIFLEYFIIEEGKMWNSVLEILQEKVKQGLDVRVIYDDIGCLLTLPFQYHKKLEAMGIQCCVFNPLVPVLTAKVNNRDHRKIAIIDGHTAFTGGANLADEYINAYDKYGHWKDSSVVVYGEAAWSFTVMFLALWGFLKNVDEDFASFKPSPNEWGNNEEGFVQPFTDNPFDQEEVSESIYLSLIGRATRNLYITTPYLILDNEMMTALCLAAKRGVDVRIVMPFQPDKWYVHAVSRSNYEPLIESGVKIYEYSPGFVHAKNFLVDDEFAVVGTINLDYRSLYLHFECGVWLYRTKSVLEVRADFLYMLESCVEITLEACRNVQWYKRIGRSFLKIFAPLM